MATGEVGLPTSHRLVLLHDDHVHAGSFSGHAAPFPLVELATAGLAAGVRVSLREHAPLPAAFVARHPDAIAGSPGLGQPVGLRVGPDDNLDEFLNAVSAAGLPLGFEIDVLPLEWLPESLAMMDQLTSRAAEHGLEIECFNLSHHYPWDMSYGGMERALAAAGGAAPFLAGYFAAIRAYLETAHFQALSHLESIRKFDRSAESGPPFASQMNLYREELDVTLDAVAHLGVALEYNTNGHNYWGQPFLTPQALARAAARGVAMVVGSDAHRPAAVAQHFTEAAAALASAGITSVVTFRSRRPVAVPLLPG